MLASGPMSSRPATLCALLLFSGCSKVEPAAPAPVASLPVAPSPAPTAPTAASAHVVGSAACATCHGDEHAAWRHDWHARALASASATSVVGDFGGKHLRGSSSEAWMKRSGDRAVMRTAGADGALADYPVDWVIGGKRMQDAITVLPDGRWQILPLYFHVTGHAWVDYTEAKQGALTPLHPYFWMNLRRTANRECLDCHATGVSVTMSPEATGWQTALADPGVACESCHGAGSVHAESQAGRDIFRPRADDPGASLAVCAQCHGPRTPLFPLLDATHRFRPGDAYDDRYQALVVTDGAQRSGDFFADGRPKTSSFEYQALLQSRCFREGKATCLSCHVAPHAPAQADELKRAPDGGAPRVPASTDAISCAGCHAKESADPQAHSHHAGTAAQSCQACHMPRVLTGVLDPFADHAIDVPNPINTARHGVPSACATCHAREKPEQLQAQLQAWWPDVGSREARRMRLADALDEATAAASLPALRGVIADLREAPTLRAAAAEILAQRFPAAASFALVPLLTEASIPLRARAARALAAAHDRPSAEALALLLKDPAISVRQAAAIALTLRNDNRGAPALYALAHDPATEGLPVPHELLAQLARSRHDLDGAASELRHATFLQPFAAETHVLLADVELQRGHPERALPELQAALRLDPGHPGARERLGRLQPAK
jgi:hypothetical protein